MRRYKQRVVSFFIGCVAIVILIELFLRISGVIYSYKIYNDKKGREGKYTILCVGDSYVYGSGAAPDKSFPVQLENLLNSNSKSNNGDFVVINRGVPAQNTAELINQLQDNIDAARPDLIILLSGGANYWNYFGYAAPSRGTDILYALRDFLYRIRIYKLAKLLCINFSNKFAALNNVSLALANRDHDENENEYSRLGDRYYAEGNYDLAIECFLKAVEFNPDVARYYSRLGLACTFKGDYSASIIYFKKALMLNPHDVHSYQSISVNYKQAGRYDEAVKFYDESSRKKVKMAQGFYNMFKNGEGINSEVEKWIRDDLENIVKICIKNKLRVVLQNYPRGWTDIGSIAKPIARKYGMPFVDNYEIFSRLDSGGSKFFVADGHCNEIGYGIMAKNLRETILKENPGILNE